MLEQANNWKHEILCFDPNHQLHNTIIWKCWQNRWKAWTIAIPSNTWRNRINILWAINLSNTKFSWLITEEKCDYSTIKQVLIEIRHDYRNWKKIILILDNAPYNHSWEVKALAKKLWIELKYLPSYSPNLNLIERLWKLLKRLLKNEYIPTLKEFFDKIINTCNDFNWKYQKEIRALLSQRIQILK